jgi:FeS assembly SUF system protein
MAVMLGNLDDALLSAGAEDEKAKSAATEVAGYDNRIAELKGEIVGVRGELTLVKWMLGFNLAMTVRLLAKPSSGPTDQGGLAMSSSAVGTSDSPEALGASVLPPEEVERMTDDIVAALKTVYDPEIPADIYELGLIYKVEIADDRTVAVDMTLTAPGCPVAGEMPTWVENAVAAVPGVKDVNVTMVFDPPWDQSRMSDEARVALDMW